MPKTIVTIRAEHNTAGQIRPLSIIWHDGREFTIDKILDMRMAASLKAGGQGILYLCRVCGKEIRLFCDDGTWFIEQ